MSPSFLARIIRNVDTPSARTLSNPLTLPTVLHIRRNHALEHATIHLLSARHPRVSLVGRSDAAGFYLLGNVPTLSVDEAVHEALARLRAGEYALAIHPQCGTNLLTSALLASAGSFLALAGGRQQTWRDRLDRLPMAIVTAVLGLIVAQPLGTAIQRKVTTSGDIGTLDVVSVRRLRAGHAALHRVLTRA